MARFTKTFTSSDPAALAASVTAFLNTLVAPTIRGVTCRYSDSARRTKGELFVAVDYSDGGAALATPFQLGVYQNRQRADLDTTINALFAANPAAFFPAVRYEVADADSGRLPAYVAFVFSNVTAGASANWLPL
jgi:hypothetical protein